MDLPQWSTNEGRHWCHIESLKSEESNFSSSGKYSRSSNSSSSSKGSHFFYDDQKYDQLDATIFDSPWV